MKQLIKYITQFEIWASHKRIAIIVSLISALILSLFSYILNNQAVLTGEDLNQFTWMQMLKHKLGIEVQVPKDNVLFVNVAYDKQLIDFNDEYNITVGNTDITDREKLFKFLRILNKTRQYAYIFLDTRFEKGYNVPETDSLLFSEIVSMNNIVVANHSDIEIADSSLLIKSAINDYNATIFSTNFVRYRYSYDDKKSMPLYAYKELTRDSIKKCGFIYTCNGRLCNNSLFIDFPIENFGEFNDDNRKMYYNLGSDLLNCYTEQDIATLTKGKYIVIGDMIDDLPDTYSGEKPGSVITYYAFLALMNGKHFVNMWLVVLMAFIFFLISMMQFSHQSLLEQIPCMRKSKSKPLHFMFSLLEYTSLLFIIVVFLNIFWNISTSIILPSFYYAIQKITIKYKRTEL